MNRFNMLTQLREDINQNKDMGFNHQSFVLSGVVVHDTNDHELIEDALQYINQNFNKKITLQSVANKLHISRNYLCHLFKVQTGYKFCEYINLQRVNKAKVLIQEDKKTFESVMHSLCRAWENGRAYEEGKKEDELETFRDALDTILYKWESGKLNEIKEIKFE